jgi:ABC-type dipeptide/oligopeptide/nickel transport system permease subunit
MRLTRSQMLEVVRQDYVRTAFAKGLSPRAVIYRHALRNSLLPVVTFIGWWGGRLLGGVVIMEIIFAVPGMGTALVQAVSYRDYPTVQAIVFVMALIFSANLVVDVYGWLIRASAMPEVARGPAWLWAWPARPTPDDGRRWAGTSRVTAGRGRGADRYRAIVAPVSRPRSPRAPRTPSPRAAGRRASHGTDHLGHHILSRVIWGALFHPRGTRRCSSASRSARGVVTAYFGGVRTASQRVVASLMARCPSSSRWR